jgi:hypothetical protein
MKKIEFIIHPKVGKQCITRDDNYVLLSYYLSERKDKENLEIEISNLELVKSGEKSFEAVYDADSFIISIGYSAGEFECDKDTAYFISNNPESEPSIEMPLQELIDLLKKWHSFLYD